MPTCNTEVYSDKNPYWYSFTCYQDGLLSFDIDPLNSEDDYDWQLFDVTGASLSDVYFNVDLAVSCNWSENPGRTGCTPSGTIDFACAGATPNISRSPQIKAGHNYLLMISHFNDSQSGYELTFTGGSSLITDTVKPALKYANTLCDGKNVYITLSKQLQCKTIAADGSDFSLNGNAVKIIAATGINCNTNFDTDSLELTFDNALPPGMYTLAVQNGTDDNTILDDCATPIPIGNSIMFEVFDVKPITMDSIVPVGCAPDTLQLYFSKSIICSSLAFDGSDFTVNTGDASVQVAGASAPCTNGLSQVVSVKLNKPIQVAGTNSISLKTGSDGNTLFDVCNLQVLPSFVNFTTADTVSAAFNYNLKIDCVSDSLFYEHDGRNGVNEWSWMFDIDGSSTARDSVFAFDNYGSKNIRLTVSNGVCTDSSSAKIVLDNELVARFYTQPLAEMCPEDPLIITDSSIGNITQYSWNYGDGTSTFLANPSPKYYQRPANVNGIIYPVTLIVQNNYNCFDTAVQNIKVLNNCIIDVPSAFTPNNDGLNDYLYPLNALKANNLVFRVYNRLGQVVFETKDWTHKWNGTINGLPQPPGTYVWILSYINADTNQQVLKRGTTVLIR